MGWYFNIFNCKKWVIASCYIRLNSNNNGNGIMP
jgi:hypothetical protein